MSAQKNVPKKQKVELLILTCLFVKGKFKETHKGFSINYPYNNKCGKTFFLAPNSLDKLMQLISMETQTYDLDRGEIADLDKFLKNHTA